MRLPSIITAVAIFLAVSLTSATAQESAKDLAARASAELRLHSSFQTLERMASQMNHILVYAIEAERGGWGVLEFVETVDYATNAYVIKRTAEDLQLEVARAENSILKSKVLTGDELGNVKSAVESLTKLFELSPQIAAMITAGDLNSAALHYHEAGQPAYENALRNAQSAVGTSQKRLSKTLLSIRLAK